jgi:hypothetical protein
MDAGSSASPVLHYTAGFVNITPTRPIPLAGHLGRTDPYAGVADDLEANVVILRDGAQPLVLISFDLLYVGGLLRRKLEQSLQSCVQPERLFLAASHTHFAPATDSTFSRPELGAVDPDYLATVIATVSSLVRDLLQGEFKPLYAGVGQAQADNAVNRRYAGWRITRRYPFVRKVVQMRPNPSGVKDETVRVLRFGSEAVIWNYACHPVFTPQMNHVSADFVGVARKSLRKKLGAKTAVLFWQGFSGDVYPSFAATMVGLTAKLKRKVFGTNGAVTPEVWQRWAERLAGHVLSASDRAVLRAITGPIRSQRSSCSLADLMDDATTDKVVGTHRISIGSDLQILGISAECVTEYGEVCRNALKNENLFCVGCIDGVFGYLPTSPMLREGGYEAVDFLPYFSLQGRFRDQLEQIVQDKLLAFD